MCSYKISSTSFFDNFNSVVLKLSDGTNLDVNVFTSSETDKFKHRGTMVTGDSKTVPLSSSTDVYIVVEPTSGTNNLNIQMTATETTSVNKTGLIIGLIVGGILFILLLVGVFAVIYYYYSRDRSKRLRKKDEISAKKNPEIRNDTPSLFAPAPTLMEVIPSQPVVDIAPVNPEPAPVPPQQPTPVVVQQPPQPVVYLEPNMVPGAGPQYPGQIPANAPGQVAPNPLPDQPGMVAGNIGNYPNVNQF